MNHLRDQQLASGAGLKAPHSPLYSQNALYKDCREEAKARSWEGKGSLSLLFAGSSHFPHQTHRPGGEPSRRSRAGRRWGSEGSICSWGTESLTSESKGPGPITRKLCMPTARAPL